jgi:hypothetical protein
LLFLGLGGILALVLVFLVYSSLDRPTWIDYYRVVDDHTLLAGTISGPGANVRVTNVTETAEAVTITVSSFYFQFGPAAAVGYPYESEAKLKDPLGSRSVLDGSSGLPVRRANCPPPSVFAPVCP